MTTPILDPRPEEGVDLSDQTPTPRKKKRKAVNRPADRPSHFRRLRGILDQATLWEFAATIPEQALEGQRRKLPTICYVAMPALAANYRSFSAAESALAEPETWAPFCEMVCEFQAKYRPFDAPIGRAELLATRPLTAQNFYDARRTWLKPHIDGLGAIFERYAAEAALEVGHADPDGPGSCNHLTRSRTLAADGKVTREPHARYRALTKSEEQPKRNITTQTHVCDVRTGQVVSSQDMEGDAHLYMTGNGAIVGYKTVRFVVRNDETNSSITLAVRRPPTKDEAACAVQAAQDIKKRLPGLLAITYDGALRGTHIRELARKSRLVTVAPIAARANDKGTRVEKSGRVAIYPHAREDGTQCVHTFHHLAGQLHEQRIDGVGNRTLTPCDDPFIRFQDNKTDHRMYLRWDVHCAAGKAPGSKPSKVGELAWTVTDDDSTFNVAENLRAIPPGSPRYADPHGWRQTIENDNHQSDSRKVQGRSRSARPEWNHLNELGWALMQNGVALQRHRNRASSATDMARAPLARAA